jgi:hypothetical protein
MDDDEDTPYLSRERMDRVIEFSQREEEMAMESLGMTSAAQNSSIVMNNGQASMEVA